MKHHTGPKYVILYGPQCTNYGGVRLDQTLCLDAWCRWLSSELIVWEVVGALPENFTTQSQSGVRVRVVVKFSRSTVSRNAERAECRTHFRAEC